MNHNSIKLEFSRFEIVKENTVIETTNLPDQRTIHPIIREYQVQFNKLRDYAILRSISTENLKKIQEQISIVLDERKEQKCQ